MRPRQLGIPTKPTRLKTGQLANIVSSVFRFARILLRKFRENLKMHSPDSASGSAAPCPAPDCPRSLG